MTNLINMNNNTNELISSYDLLTHFINPARVEAGKGPLENSKLTKKIEEEFGDDIKGRKKVDPVKTAGGKQAMVVYDLTKDQCFQIAMREVKAVRVIAIEKMKELEKRLNVAEQAIDAIAISESHEEAVYLAKVAKAERNALRIGCKSDNLRIDEIKKQDSLGVHGFEHVFLNTRVSMHLFGCAPDTFKKNTGLSMRDYFESISDVENLHKIGRTLERAITLAELGFSKDEIMAKFPANETKYFG